MSAGDEIAAILGEVLTPRLFLRWLRDRCDREPDRLFLCAGEHGERPDPIEEYLLEATGREWCAGFETVGTRPYDDVPQGWVQMPRWYTDVTEAFLCACAEVGLRAEDAYYAALGALAFELREGDHAL